MLSLRQIVRPRCLTPLAAAVAASAAPTLAGPAGPFLCRSYAAPSSNRTPRSAPPRRAVRSLAEIEADKMELRADGVGARWVPTTEPEEDAQMTVFERPPSSPTWAVLLFAVSMTSCFTAASLSMTDLLDKKVVQEGAFSPEGVVLADGTLETLANAPESASIFDGVLGYIPSKLPNISSTWAYVYAAVAVAVPIAVLTLASRTGARVIKYRPSGRIRVYSRLDNQLGKGKLVDFGIAEGLLKNGATIDNLQIVTLHLPPLGFDPAAKHAKLKLPTVNLDMRPVSKEDIASARAAGQNVVVDQALLAQAFGGISTKIKKKVGPKD